jgi:hypothetical protein
MIGPPAARNGVSSYSRGGICVLLSAGDAVLTPVTTVDGFVFACLVDQATGMTLAGTPEQSEIYAAAAAAGAADIANALTLMSARLATNETVEDVIVTFSDYFHLIRPVSRDAAQRILLLVMLDRRQANLAMARREIRTFCATLT